MDKNKIVKIALDKPVKLNSKWYNPPRTLKVELSIASDIILAKAGHFTDPDEAVDVSELENLKDTKSLTGSGNANPNRDSVVSALCDIEGISTDLAEKLIDAGFTSVNDVYNADAEALCVVKGIGEKLVKTIQESASALVTPEE